MSHKGEWKNEEHRPFTPLPDYYHCSRILQEHWWRFPCPDEAVVVYAMPDGTKVGWCFKHAREGQKHAETRGWEKVAA